MRKIVSAAIAAGVLVAAGSASAATATTTFAVSATVQKACTVSAAALAFGNYTPGSGALTGNTTVSVACTKGTAYTVALNGGSTTGGTIAQRLMVLSGGTDTLQYNLYTSTALTTLFGDGTTGSTGTGTGTGLGTTNALTVYGSLPDSTANKAVTPGSYSDTVTVTVTY